MITNLKLAFKSLLEDATWMDSATKSVARDKIEAMVEFVGYPAWLSYDQFILSLFNLYFNTSLI